MTRRTLPPPPVDPDDYGFDVAGKSFKVTSRELLMLVGVDTITCALYMRCLKPFADRYGAVRAASFYRFLQILKVVQSPGGGQRLPEPTRKQLRRALDRLRQAKLITMRDDANQGERVLKIWLNVTSRSSPKV